MTPKFRFEQAVILKIGDAEVEGKIFKTKMNSSNDGIDYQIRTKEGVLYSVSEKEIKDAEDNA
jgi:hypothetical protein